MHYNYLPLIHVFRLVAECGSFQGAALTLNLPRSSVSKKIRQLEEVIGQPLLRRSTRQLYITEAGQQLLEQTTSLSDVLFGVEEIIQGLSARPSGKVTLSMGVLHGREFIQPLLKKLCNQFPAIELVVNFDDETVDLLADDVDITLRIGDLPDSMLVARKLGEKHWGWFAAPEYIERQGMPESPAQLTEHSCLVFKNNDVNFCHWPFQNSQGVTETIEIKAALSTNNSRALIEMACDGLGIIMVDPLMVRSYVKNGDLLPIFTDWQHPESKPISLVSQKKRSRAAQAVWEFLLAHIKV